MCECANVRICKYANACPPKRSEGGCEGANALSTEAQRRKVEMEVKGKMHDEMGG